MVQGLGLWVWGLGLRLLVRGCVRASRALLSSLGVLESFIKCQGF